MSRYYPWGVDGYGDKHLYCGYCEIVFGKVDPEKIEHSCDKTKPRYHNRDKIFQRTKTK